MLNTYLSLEATIAGLPLFSGLQDVAIRRLAGGTTQIRAHRGTLIFHPATPCGGLYVVIGGRVKLSRSVRKGSELVLAIAAPGDSLCVEILFRDQTYGTSAEALEDVLLVHVAKPTLLAELEHNIAFARALIQALSGRVASVLQDLECCTLQSARERVAGFLLRHASEAEGLPPSSLRLPASKGVVASHLNLTHEHFSRVLRQLSEEGLIRVEGRDIAIPDLPRLRMMLA